MTKPRASLVSVADTPYYHVIARCVRRAFLCGEDCVSGKSFNHRRAWLLDRLKLLTDTFAIDLCAYALMSNHYHLVVHIDVERVQGWCERDVVERWCRLFSGPAYAQRFLAGGELADWERVLLARDLERWSARLSDLSWFMRCLNEWLARAANVEDGCTGRFWEGRFKSQALLDETALLTAMAYVDLNPIRAGLAATVSESDFTSMQQRLFEIARSPGAHSAAADSVIPSLVPFVDAALADKCAVVPFGLQDYFDLVDTSGRIARADTRGVIAGETPRLLQTLGIAQDEWFSTVTQMQSRFELFVGAPHRLKHIAAQRGWRWLRGLSAARRLYARANG
jgi:REP element-mobilizing transposase RayT